MKFSQKMIKLRKERGWSQTDLSRRVGTHIAHLSRLENGKSQPSVELLWKLSRVFGVTADFLLDDEVNDLSPVTISNKPLAEKLSMIEKLEERDQQTIINVIDAMLTKQKMIEVLIKNEPALASG